jgi:hypothetical protein
MESSLGKRPGSHRAGLLRVFRAPEDDRVDEARHIGSLVDTWLKSRDGSRPGAGLARRGERKLHEAIKAGPLYGKILSFAGLNIWVDEWTSDGVVMSQECVNL